MASDTPMTDAEKIDAYNHTGEVVDYYFACRLERQLSAARAECIEQARLNGIGSERELKLMAEIERLRRDAERYRYFKLHLHEPYAVDHFVAFNNWHTDDRAKLTDLDAAIDAAIAREGRE